MSVTGTMMTRCTLPSRRGLACLVAERGRAAEISPPTSIFESKVRPVLVNQCGTCHSDAKRGGLALTSRDTMLKGGDSGPAVAPGVPEKSLLIRPSATSTMSRCRPRRNCPTPTSRC
jgi:hypothetical protein